MNIRIGILAILAILAGSVAVAPSANAGNPCDPGTKVDVAGIIYIVIFPRGNTDNGLWIYLESNGESGLQRGGEHPVLGYSEICQESGNPDLMVF